MLSCLQAHRTGHPPGTGDPPRVSGERGVTCFLWALMSLCVQTRGGVVVWWQQQPLHPGVSFRNPSSPLAPSLTSTHGAAPWHREEPEGHGSEGQGAVSGEPGSGRLSRVEAQGPGP